MSLPVDLRNRGILLLNQQCWVWGRDILRPEGNLLIEYGFDKTKPPKGIEGSTQYTFKMASGTIIRLWGFGMFYGRTRGIHLNRYEFEPRVARITNDLWRADRLGPMVPLRRYSGLRPILLWIASYEEWVLTRYGRTYRKQCLIGWKKKNVNPGSVSQQWAELADDIHLWWDHEGSHQRRTGILARFDSTHIKTAVTPLSTRGLPIVRTRLRGTWKSQNSGAVDDDDENANTLGESPRKGIQYSPRGQQN